MYTENSEYNRLFLTLSQLLLWPLVEIGKLLAVRKS